jgi:hypothetical protein
VRYLLISYRRKANGQIDEMVSITKRVTSDNLLDSSVILDFADNKILKCVIEGKLHETTFELMRNYYSKIYPKVIEQLEREAPIEKGKEKLTSKKKW